MIIPFPYNWESLSFSFPSPSTQPYFPYTALYVYCTVYQCMYVYVCVYHALYFYTKIFIVLYIIIFTNILTSCLQESNEALLADFQRNLLQRERELEEIRSMVRGAQVRVCCY